MIKNEREYKISKRWVQQFEQALAAAQARKPQDANQAERFRVRAAGIQSQLEELRENLSDYEALKSGETSSFVAHSLTDLPTLLIQARIAQNLTHKQLAERLGVSEKQVQRDEAQDYASAGLNRLIKVAAALEIRLEVKAELEAV